MGAPHQWRVAGRPCSENLHSGTNTRHQAEQNRHPQCTSSVGRERNARAAAFIQRGSWCVAQLSRQVLVAGVGVAGAEGCDHGVQRQLPVSAHSRKAESPHAHEHAPMRARTRTWQRFGGLSLPLPT